MADVSDGAGTKRTFSSANGVPSPTAAISLASNSCWASTGAGVGCGVVVGSAFAPSQRSAATAENAGTVRDLLESGWQGSPKERVTGKKCKPCDY